MGRVVWTDRALSELEAMYDYVALNSPRIARLLTERMLEAADRLGEFPLSGRVVPEIQDEQLREVIVSPYRLIYRVRKDLVEVLTVHHGARRLRSVED